MTAPTPKALMNKWFPMYVGQILRIPPGSSSFVIYPGLTMEQIEAHNAKVDKFVENYRDGMYGVKMATAIMENLLDQKHRLFGLPIRSKEKPGIYVLPAKGKKE